MEKRETDSHDFIRPQREHADMVVQFYTPQGASAEGANGHLNVRLILRPAIPHPDMTYLAEKQLAVEVFAPLPDAASRHDLPGGEAEPRHGHPSLWRHLPGTDPIDVDQFGVYQDRGMKRQSDPLALTQLLLTYHLLRECGENNERLFASPVAGLSRVSRAGAAPVPEPVGQLR
jgi:phosphoribulokinase